MITECYDCVFANEYLAWWWYPSIKPHLQVRTSNAHKTQMQRLQTNREEKQMKRLPQTKYELFKKWYGLSEYSNYNSISDIFEDFELWCKNQENECEVIETISEITGSRGLARQILMALQEGGYLNDSL